MKMFLFTIALLFAYISVSKAQSDTLFINLKNNQSEKIAVSDIQKITFENVSAIVEAGKPTSHFITKGNYPNPFDEQTNIEFEIASEGNVIVFIYDSKGNQIQKLECVNCQAGKNSLQWNCLDKNNDPVQSGVYYYEVRFGGDAQSKKMLLVK